MIWAITLIAAIVFTLAAVASTVGRRGRFWWAFTVLLVLAALVAWLRLFEVM